VRDQRHGEAVVVQARHRQAGAFDRDGALLDHVAEQLRRGVEPDALAVALGVDAPHRADAVDVALHVVAAERLAGAKRRLDVDTCARRQAAERRALERLGHRVEGEQRVVDGHDGETDAGDRNGIADERVA
jgi:hypothetical protein